MCNNKIPYTVWCWYEVKYYSFIFARDQIRDHKEWWKSGAKSFLDVCAMGRTPRPLCPVRLLYESWCVDVHGKKLSSIDYTTLYETFFAPRLKKSEYRLE